MSHVKAHNPHLLDGYVRGASPVAPALQRKDDTSTPRPRTAEDDFDAYEAAMVAERLKAKEAGRLRPMTFTAWNALSQRMIALRVQVRAGQPDRTAQSSAAALARGFCQSLHDETKGHERPLPSLGGMAASSSNSYTDEITTVAPFFARTAGAATELPEALEGGDFTRAFEAYRRVVTGLDRWIVDQLKRQKGEHAPETQRADLIAGRRCELAGLEGRNARAIDATFTPDAKYKDEKGAEQIRTVPRIRSPPGQAHAAA